MSGLVGSGVLHTVVVTSQKHTLISLSARAVSAPRDRKRAARTQDDTKRVEESVVPARKHHTAKDCASVQTSICSATRKFSTQDSEPIGTLCVAATLVRIRPLNVRE